MFKQQYSPSVNIIRDLGKSINYIVTPNSTQIATSIFSGFETTSHCFNIIGSYGTGKSSFIWALEQNLKQNKNYFCETGEVLNKAEEFEFINIIGSFSSIIEKFALIFDVLKPTPSNILEAIDSYYKKCSEQGKFLFIVIDEYGKFLEYASQNNSEESVYFIQQLAEYINDTDKNILLLTSLHQNFAQYGAKLNSQERNEWKKVSGRFVDLTFNEPVEQLLFLAGERIKQWGFQTKKTPEIKTINEALFSAKILTNGANYNLNFAESLFPLDLASANCLTKALQAYGQNERSLFTFLDKKGIHSLQQYSEKDKWFHLGMVYDFLIHNFYGFIISSSNPDKNGWDAIKIALEKVEANFNGDIKIATFIVKAIGLLNIFASQGGKINGDLLISYFCRYAKNEIEEILEKLSNQKIIRFREFSSRYILFEGTDLDFDKAMIEAELKIKPNVNIAENLKMYYQLPYILAKSVSYKVGTPRFFKYIISETPINIKPENELDGFINLIFSEDLNQEDILKLTSSSDNAIIYALFVRTKEIKKILFDIDKIILVKKENEIDNVATRELNALKEALENKLAQEILKNLTTKNKNVIWFKKGKKIKIGSNKDLNHELSNICEEVYSRTPILKNELINKHKLSTPIATARRNYMRALINNSNKDDLGFEKDKYPAEKTIYLSLLANTQLHQHIGDNRWEFIEPNENNVFFELWQKSLEILNRGKQEKLGLKIFYEELSKAPYKLKEGFLAFWIPTFLHIQQNNFALYNTKGYLPFLTEEVYELIHKSPKDFSFKTFSVDGIKLNLLNTYRSLMNKKSEETGTRSIYIETIRPLLIFHRDLPNYTKNTKNISSEAILFRASIAKAQDPETAFFQDIPNALGYSGLDLRNESVDLENYTKQLKDTIKELRECETILLNDIENTFISIIGMKNKSFKEYKEKLESRFEGINIQIIPSHLKRLLSRILVPCGNKTDWIKGLFNSLLNKGFSEIKDEEIPIFVNKFKKAFKQLERLIDIHQLNATRDNESICSVDIIDLEGNVKQERIIFAKKTSEAFMQSENKIDKLIKNLKPEEQKALLLKKLQELI